MSALPAVCAAAWTVDATSPPRGRRVHSSRARGCFLEHRWKSPQQSPSLLLRLRPPKARLAMGVCPGATHSCDDDVHCCWLPPEEAFVPPRASTVRTALVTVMLSVKKTSAKNISPFFCTGDIKRRRWWLHASMQRQLLGRELMNHILMMYWRCILLWLYEDDALWWLLLLVATVDEVS